MLVTNANFDAKHALDYKTPIYVIEFDGVGEPVFCNREPFPYVTTGTVTRGNCRLDLTATNAFAWLAGVDLSGYQTGRYKLTITDSAGATLTGYISATAPGGETYGTECVTNGDMELDSDWADYNTPTANARDGIWAPHGGTYSRTFTVDAQYDGITQTTVTVVTGGHYYLSCWLACSSFPTIKQMTARVHNSTDYRFILNQDVVLAWTEFTYHWSALDTNARPQFFSAAGVDSGTFYVDDVTIKRVTDCPATGALIVSEAGGATRAWAEEETGFDRNDAAGYTYTIESVYKSYLVSISGSEQKVTPEEGTASIGGFKIDILDYDDEITALLATDSYFFHRKKTTVKAGYLGMTEADMLTIATAWVTNYELSSDGTTYSLQITDPKKWFQRKIFRGAETAPVTVQGNPINILLAILTSTGAGTNGDYDWYDSSNGLGLTSDYINVSAIESVRDDWFPGDSHYMRFYIDKRVVAKDFIEKEICKPLNLYPVIDGQGRFSIKPFKPPLAALDEVQSFDEDNIIGIPKWSANLESVINEIEIYYDHNSSSDEFDSEIYYVDSDSVNNRGPGKKAIEIKTKGLKTSNGTASIAGRGADILAIRKNRIFGRWATPPVSLKIKTFFTQWLSEAGDIVPITHPLLPDVEAGTRGLDEARMEIVNRSVDWKRGSVSIDLLNTGFARSIYGVVSPTMTITSATASTCFNVSTADANKYIHYTSPEVSIHDYKMRQKVAAVTINSLSTAGYASVDDMGLTPAAGDIVTFADYEACSEFQRKYAFSADSSNQLGTTNATVELIAP